MIVVQAILLQYVHTDPAVISRITIQEHRCGLTLLVQLIAITPGNCCRSISRVDR